MASGEAVQDAVQVDGDYYLRGPNIETRLIKAVTGSIIDAARYVREGVHGDNGWNNGFPNWAMYRTALAGDTHLAANLLAWCKAFGAAHAVSHTRQGELVGMCAGRDGFSFLLTKQWGASAEKVATALGISPKTYRSIRNRVAARLEGSLREYWMRLDIAMRQVAIQERRQIAATPPSLMRDGRGFGDEADGNMMLGDGNLRAMQKYIE